MITYIDIKFLLFLCFVFNFGTAYGQHSPRRSVKEIFTNYKPKFLSKPINVYVHKYQSVTFNCSVDRLGDYVMIWKRNDQTLSFNERLYFRQYALEMINQNGFSLKIKNVTEELATGYSCHVSPADNMVQNFSIGIIKAPEIQQYPGNGMVEAEAGSTVHLKCNVTGNPMPKVTWTKNGVEYKQGVTGDFGEKLMIKAATRVSEGVYKCLASNKMTKDVMAAFKVSVKFRPEVEVDSDYVHGGEGKETVIMCIAHASHPIKRIAWLQEGGNEVKDVLRSIDNSGSTHTIKLVIRKLSKENFGEYTCVVENDLGVDRKKIYISGIAERVKVIGNERGDSENAYTLKWSVKSFSPISKYIIKYRETKHSRRPYKSIVVRATESSNTDENHLQQYNILNLKKATKYDVVMQAMNEYGLNKPSDVFTFQTKSEYEYDDLNNEIKVDAQAQGPQGNSSEKFNFSFYTIVAIMIFHFL